MQVHHALATLERLGLVRRETDVEQGFSFKHILVQETAYASLLRQDRRTMHRVIGDIYQSLFAAQLDEYLLPLAFHYGEAGENDRAFDFLVQYGERATRLSAYPEAIAAYERALALTEQSASLPRARVLAQLGEIYCRRANFDAANESFQAALQIVTRAGDASAAANVWSGLARVATQQGEHIQARELGERALEWAQEAQNKEAMARAHRQLGVSYNLEGNNSLAQRHLLSALDLFREVGDTEGTASALNSLGVVAREDHELDRAWAFFQDALALGEERGDKYGMGVRLNNLGVIAEQRGDLETATQYQEKAHALALEIGDREGAALTELNLGSLALTRGEATHALKHFQHALAETIAINSIPYALYALACCAKWEVEQMNFKRGAELLGLAFRHPSSTADIPIDFDSVVTELKARMGEAEFQTAFARGKTLNMRETVKNILARKEQG